NLISVWIVIKIPPWHWPESVILTLNPGWAAGMSGNWNSFPEDLNTAAFEHEFEAPWSGAAERLSADPVSTVPATAGCPWLYKNIVMDANGRILPCCASPAPDKELVFSQFDDVDAGDLFIP